MYERLFQIESRVLIQKSFCLHLVYLWWNIRRIVIGQK